MTNDEAAEMAKEAEAAENPKTDEETADPLIMAEQEREKAATYLLNWQRAQADFVNFKRRTEQEKLETARFANVALIGSLLPVLDDLERAINNTPPEVAGTNWYEGLQLIYRKLVSTLEAQGVNEIPCQGEDFDPNLHHAVLYEEGGEEGKVIQEFQKGYRLHDRVIRAAMVKVGKGANS